MEKYLSVLTKMNLFDGIRPEQLSAILSCLNASEKEYEKDEIITFSGGNVNSFGIVLSGTVQILKEDVAGRQSILSSLGAGETFAEVFVCAGIKKSPVTVLAATQANILFLDYRRVVQTCSNSCEFHSRLITNLLKVLAQKNLVISGKISYLLLKSMRQKLAAYLLDQSKAGGTAFTIPFSRSQLADYLSVDRSALSRELSRMQEDGLIVYHKSTFSISDPERLAESIS